jgi:zinc protease
MSLTMLSLRIRARRFLFSGIGALVVVAAVAAAPQQRPTAPGVATAPLDQVITVDPKISVGTLPNGLRFYVRANRQPQGRAELRLVVKAGSILEDEDQRGLAHFVEHIAFNGTRHFPKQDITAFMQALGMRFGAHVNAQTSFDETIYELQIPTDSPAVVDRSLLILEDWAQQVSFDPTEIDKERGVILEEWRQGLGADARMKDAQLPVLLKGSRYAERSPIGRPEIIRNVSYARLKQFYTDWYRPDLMAVIAVGDFDPAVVEASIKAHFGPIPAAVSPRPRPAYAVPDHPGTLYAIATDREARGTTVGVFHKGPARNQRTVGAYRQQMVERLFSGMLSDRLDEIASKPGAPFLAAQTSRGLFVRTAEVTALNALVRDDGVTGGLGALFAEAERVARDGFTATELDRQKLNSKLGLEQALIERDKSPSAPLAAEFIRNFMDDEPIPGIVYEYGMYERFLPQITLAEVNAVAKTWIPDGNRVVLVSAPERAGTKPPTEAALAAVVKESGTRTLSAYVDGVNTKPLLETPPTPGTIARTSTLEALGLTEWQLSNGVRVVLKPTTIKEDEILFRAVSPGGTSLSTDANFIAARTADDVIGLGGLGALSRQDLTRALAGANTAVRAEIGDTEEGLRGGSSRRDLETMFQLIYLTFTAPRADRDAFEVLTSQLKVTLAHEAAQPEAAFEDTLSAALTQNHARGRPMTAALVDQMNLNASLAFYKNRFADASDFTFVFVGNFDVPTIKPLVERYLGSLPAIRRTESARDVGMHTPAGVVEKQVVKGSAPKSEVAIVFSGPFQNDERHRVLVDTMAAMLGGNLNRTLREDLGGTYGVRVEPTFVKSPAGEYRVAISFGCDPERVDDLTKTAWRVIEQFKQAGPSTGQVSDAHNALERDLEANLQENSYLVNQIAVKYSYGEDVSEVFNPRAFFEQITPQAIRDAARQYLNQSRYVQVTLRPERK